MSGVYTALGLKEAHAFLAGYQGRGGRWRRGRNPSGGRITGKAGRDAEALRRSQAAREQRRSRRGRFT